MCTFKVHINVQMRTCTFDVHFESAHKCARALINVHTLHVHFHVHVPIRVSEWYQKYLLSSGASCVQKLTCTLRSACSVLLLFLLLISLLSVSLVFAFCFTLTAFLNLSSSTLV